MTDRTDRTGGGDARHVDRWLDAWRTGELEGPRAAEVEAHLESCPACRDALAELEAFAATVEAGYRDSEAGRAEPDWAASRAAIVARTSARPGRRTARLLRWVPQLALVLVAVVAIGVLVEEGVRGPEDVGPAFERSAAERSAPPAPATEGEALEGTAREPRANEDAVRVEPLPGPSPTEPSAETDAAQPMANVPPPPPADRDDLAAGAPGARDEAGAAVREEAEVPAQEAARAPETRAAAAQKALPAPERFRRRADEALDARDTTLAKAALSLWADTVRASELSDAERERLEALADRLADFLASVP